MSVETVIPRSSVLTMWAPVGTGLALPTCWLVPRLVPTALTLVSLQVGGEACDGRVKSERRHCKAWVPHVTRQPFALPTSPLSRLEG